VVHFAARRTGFRIAAFFGRQDNNRCHRHLVLPDEKPSRFAREWIMR
jgi:hypothetical protein